MTELLTNPEPTFKVDGEAQGLLTRDAVSLLVAEDTQGLRTLELTLTAEAPSQPASGDSLLWLDGTSLDFGSELEVTLGAGDEARTVFTGVVSSLEATFEHDNAAHVRVLAEDALMRLRLRRRCQTWSKVSDADIAKKLADEHELQVQADAPGPTYDVLQQWNQSDLAFLRERARRLSAEVWVKDGVLHFASRAARTGETFTLTRGVELLAIAVRADLAHQRSKVHVGGYDAARREKLDGKGETSAIQAEAPEGQTGPAILARVFDGAHESLRVRDVPLEGAEADAWATAQMLRRARGFVTAEGTTRGTAALDVGSRLTLQGIGRPFSGEGYYVTAVRHVWGRAEGYRTHFQAERPTVNDS
ncbi:MAG: phage late control D family protein [Myxococcota bacterium]